MATTSRIIDPTRYPNGGLERLEHRAGRRHGGWRRPASWSSASAPIACSPTGVVLDRRHEPAPGGARWRWVARSGWRASTSSNYFNGNGQGGGFPTSRGATTPVEFARQRAKTIATLAAIECGRRRPDGDRERRRWLQRDRGPGGGPERGHGPRAPTPSSTPAWWAPTRSASPSSTNPPR